MRKPPIRFNVLLDDTRRAHLEALAMKSGISRGAVLRQLIDFAFQMSLKALPTCASGQHCFCPQMHPSLPPDPNPTQGD